MSLHFARSLPGSALAIAAGCAAPGHAPDWFAAEVRAQTDAVPGAWIGACYEDLASGAVAQVDAATPVHAASTIKVAVLIELFRQAEQGRIDLDGALHLRNSFASLVDGSPFALAPADDSDPALYARAGTLVPIRELARRMIVRSSNLATNALIARLGVAPIQRTIEALGATDTQLLRGLEDAKAFRAGRNNVTTARDLATLLGAIARGTAASRASCEAMLAILTAQEFREMIPAGLPPATVVANKTGSITRVHHDAAIVFEAGRPAWILVVTTRGFPDPDASAAAGAAIARRCWRARAGR